jgi:hypothetical protein
MQPLAPILSPESFRDLVSEFNATDPDEDIINLVSNAQSWDWMTENIPFFDCPDETLRRIYYYRWWTFRKHLKQTPAGIIVTEFISPVRHAGSYNSISCATGLHLAEGRWIRDPRYIDEYTRFWYRANDGKPEPGFHKYSGWVTWAALERAMVTGDRSILLDLLDDFIADYRTWENEKLLPNGLFWQFDVRDGMEESISGSRTHKNARPTINSYMFANAKAISQVAGWAGRTEVVQEFNAKATRLKELVQMHLWDSEAQFFKAQTQENGLSSAREAIGFVPWCFGLPDPPFDVAWRQLSDPDGFWAPKGLTTAERRHPQFRTHGVGRCEWDGAVWPFATSQTLSSFSCAVRARPDRRAPSPLLMEAVMIYARSHEKNGKPYIGEYHDEATGEWLKGDNPRSRFYNHSTFADLIINALIGLIPQFGNEVKIDPLIPADAWDWFCLDRVHYHGRDLTILWDRTGTRYRRGAGLQILCDGEPIARSDKLQTLIGHLS